MKIIEEDTIDIYNDAIKLGFKNKSFLITGATGMIGQLLVGALKNITDENKIIVFGKDKNEAERIFANTCIVCSSFEEIASLPKADFVIHLASPTNSKFLAEKPVETIDFIYRSTKKMLDYSLKHKSKMLYVSSMETFGEVFDESKKKETNLGYISLESTRSSYPESKRLCELLCFSYAREYGLDVYTARLAQTFGAGTSLNDPRIFGYISRCVVNNENIVLNTKGDTVGNYCYISDTIRAFFYIFAKGESGLSYNVVGDNCRSTIYDLAEMVSKKLANNSIDVVTNLGSDIIYPNPTKLNMDNTRIKKLGWEPKYDLLSMFQRMIESEINKND